MSIAGNPKKELEEQEARAEEERLKKLSRAPAPPKHPFRASVPARFPMLAPYGPPLASVLNTSLFVAKRDADVKPSRLVTQLYLASDKKALQGDDAGDYSYSSGVGADSASSLRQQQPQPQVAPRNVPFSTNALDLRSFPHREAPAKRTWLEPHPDNIPWAVALKEHQLLGALPHHSKNLAPRGSVPTISSVRTVAALSEPVLRLVFSFCEGSTMRTSLVLVCRHWRMLLLLKDKTLTMRMMAFEPPPELFQYLDGKGWPREGIVRYLVDQQEQRRSMGFANSTAYVNKDEQRQTTTSSASDPVFATPSGAAIHGFFASAGSGKQQQMTMMSGPVPSPRRQEIAALYSANLRTGSGARVLAPIANKNNNNNSNDTDSRGKKLVVAVSGAMEKKQQQQQQQPSTYGAARTSSASSSVFFNPHQAPQPNSRHVVASLRTVCATATPLPGSGGASTEVSVAVARFPITCAVVTPDAESNATSVKKQSALRAALITPSQAPFHFTTASIPFPWAGIDFGPAFRICVTSYALRTAYRNRMQAWQLQGTRDSFDDWAKCHWDVLDARTLDESDSKFLIERPDELPPVAVLSSPLTSDLVHRELKRRFSMRALRLGDFDVPQRQRDLVTKALQPQKSANQFPVSSSSDGTFHGFEYSGRDFNRGAGRHQGDDDQDEDNKDNSHLDFDTAPAPLMPHLLSHPSWDAGAEIVDVRDYDRARQKQQTRGCSSDNASSSFGGARNNSSNLRSSVPSRPSGDVDEFVWGHFDLASSCNTAARVPRSHRSSSAAKAAHPHSAHTRVGDKSDNNNHNNIANVCSKMKHVDVLQEGYRRLRLVQCGRNASWGLELHLCGFEVYGQIMKKKGVL